jgi:tRNA(adenine34) deaminase
MHKQDQDIRYMRQALALAAKAQALGEVPVGALVVLDNDVIGTGFNTPISGHDPSAHAEIIALRAAAAHTQNYRLTGATLYVTLEPCMMCAGAMVHARVGRVVFGAFDPKTGVASSAAQLFESDFLNHQIEVTGGVLQDECSAQLKAFFKARR